LLCVRIVATLRTLPVTHAKYLRFMGHARALQSLPDRELVRRVIDLTGSGRRNEAELIEHIAEFDRRKLYASEGAASLFAWCLQVLHLSEAETVLRIRAARAAREHPVILAMLADGRLHLSAVVMIAPHLERENADRLLAKISHRTKTEVEKVVAEIDPQPDVRAAMRRLRRQCSAVLARSGRRCCVALARWGPAREQRLFLRAPCVRSLPHRLPCRRLRLRGMRLPLLLLGASVIPATANEGGKAVSALRPRVPANDGIRRTPGT
jgi:hypothetical protein